MVARRTPLFDVHTKLGARMVEFAGFEMPTSYDGIIAEHRRVRSKVGLFDVSHMGEVRVKGPQALEVVNRLITNDLHRIKDKRALYTTMCAEDGTIVDDLIVYRLSPEEIFICVNAANDDSDFAHMQAHASGDAELTHESDRWAQIAVQGPRAPELLSRVFGDRYLTLPPFRIRKIQVEGEPAYLSTTGYTGERGAEVYVPAPVAAAVWDTLMDHGDYLEVGPVGLGARDTLRLEAGLCLYGNDIDRTTTPLEAGLGWVTRLKKPEFVGREALRRQKEAGVTRRLVGIEVFDRGIPRHGYAVLAGDEAVGEITSGTKSPWTGRAIGMAYVPIGLATPGTELVVDCRGRQKPAKVVEMPFFNPTGGPGR